MTTPPTPARPRVRRAGAALAIGGLAASTLTGCGAGSGQQLHTAADVRPPAPVTALRLGIDPAPHRSLAAGDVVVSGSARVAVRVVSGSGGHVRPQAVTIDGVRRGAARFPALDPSDPAPRAAIEVTSRAGTDELAPGDRPFSFGADVALAARNESDAPGSSDDGNNVVQWGLFTSASQYKLQVDHGRPSCVVRGSVGALFVRAERPLVPRTWYRLTCARSADSLTLTVARAGAPAERRTERGDAGPLPAGPAPVPLAIGAKIDDRGRIPSSSSDQFNGLVSRVLLRIRDHAP